jgi:hypothetical protein
MRKHIALAFSLGAFLAAAVPATLQSATLEAPSGLCVQTLLDLNCAPIDPTPAEVTWHPGHYVMNQYRKILHEKHFKGAKVFYYWRDLEPSKGNYDFSRIERELAILQQHGKRLFIHVGIKSFGYNARRAACCPEYLRAMDGIQTGVREDIGVERAFARIAKPEVAERVAALVQALGKRFNEEPYIEGVILPETSSIGGTQAKPEYAEYYKALKYLVKAFREAFPNKVVLQSANWLIGTPNSDRDMKELFEYMEAQGVGASGPDLMPTRTTTSSRLYPEFYGRIPLAIDNQRAELVGVNPQAAFQFAIDDPKGLQVNYLFWEPWNDGIWSFDGKIVPLVNDRNGKIHTQCPKNLSCSTNQES